MEDNISVYRQAGYDSFLDYLNRVGMYIIGVALVLFLASVFVFLGRGLLSIFLPIVVLILGATVFFLYPYLIYEKRKMAIEENIHLFVTYFGVLSILQLSRRKMFGVLSKKNEYGDITDIIGKIYYLAEKWKIGYAETCHRISSLVPSKMFGDFLDRLAAAFTFGEDLEVFLAEEQQNVMDDYDLMYKKAFNNIAIVQDISMSMIIAVAFVISAAMLLPILAGFSIYSVLALSIVFLMLIDVVVLIYIESFIPKDQICHSLKPRDAEGEHVRRVLMASCPIVLMLFIIFQLLGFFPLFANVSIALIPLAYVGYLGNQREALVMRRDRAFPAFLESLGGSWTSRGGNLVGTLGELRVHDFGILQHFVENLYRRLKVYSDKTESWTFFAAETGSDMIYKFSSIFADVTMLGAEPSKVSEMINENFMRLLSLRQLRLQLTSGFRGVIFGTMVGFSAAIYISVEIANVLFVVFASATRSVISTPSVSGILQGILPKIPEFPIDEIYMLLAITLLIHSAMSAYALKLVGGTTHYSALLDFSILSWLAAAMSVVVPFSLSMIFGDMMLNASGAFASVI